MGNVKETLDKNLLLVIVFFFGLGLVQVYSSSYVLATEYYGDGTYFFKKKIVHTLLGAIVLFATLLIPWSFFEKWGALIWGLAVGAVVLTAFPETSIKINGATRWVTLPFEQRFQPVEFLKFSYPLILAHFFVKNYNWGKVKIPLQAFIVLFPLVFLLKQPDFGGFAICLLLLGLLLFAFGLHWKYLVGFAVFTVSSFFYLIRYKAYRWDRVLSFIDPWADPEQKGFQLIQSLIGYYSGGFFGNGLGQGQSKLFFLPEAHTDFTLSVLGEELGFLGVLIVSILYGFIILRGFQITLNALKKDHQIVALGVTLVFGTSTIINMGVSLGLLPTKGLALPFLSYGGSSMIAACFGLGLLLNIDRQSNSKRTTIRGTMKKGYKFNPYKS